MKIAITGASGLLGGALAARLVADGHEVWRLIRGGGREGRAGCIAWSPASGTIESSKLEGVDAVAHLAGENIAAGRWTAAKKQRIRDSRVNSTKLLAETLASLKRKPAVLISASAVGIYGNRGDEILTEESSPGGDFLAQVGREWEAANEPAERAGIRVAHLRFGVILTPQGGALAKMLPVFRLGLGGVVGNGNQWWSWITLEDAVGVIVQALQQSDWRGPINTVSPNPVTNREFTQALARVLRRPAVFPAPAFLLRLAIGEMADAALLASQRVTPAKLLAAGFSFRHPQLEPALRALLATDGGQHD